MSTFEPFLDILPEKQLQYWPKIQSLSKLDFVLYGGTAIALQLGHRLSIDYDFFSSSTLNKELLFKEYPWLLNSQTIQDEPNSLSLLVGADGGKPVKFSFFGGLNLEHFAEPLTPSGDELLVASLDDLFATKLKVLFQRIEVKDYQDIAALLASGNDLGLALSIAKEMYKPTFEPQQSLLALTCFDGADLNDLTSKEKNQIESSVRELYKRDQLPLVELKTGLKSTHRKPTT
jgi:hypothetical protein